jgi:hypothetical protein
VRLEGMLGPSKRGGQLSSADSAVFGHSTAVP